LGVHGGRSYGPSPRGSSIIHEGRFLPSKYVIDTFGIYSLLSIATRGVLALFLEKMTRLFVRSFMFRVTFVI
jgi:hypothetical protein